MAILRGLGRSAHTCLISFGIAAVGTAPVAAGPTGWPSDVAARYKLYFNGFEVGKYSFESRFDGKAYAAQSNAEISALFGAFRWKGNIQSRGTIDAAAPKPASYQMDYKSKSKAVQVKLGFDTSGVTSVALTPNKPPHPDAIPLKPDNLKSVFDPMTAILAISHPGSANPCDRKIPIFDGKARFDLEMSLKGRQKITDKAPSGQPTQLVVCKIKYVPIAGHKPKDFANPWVDYSGIEITLRQIPSAGIFVPYTISIPTSIGSAVMSAESVNITAPGKAQIALTQ